MVRISNVSFSTLLTILLCCLIFLGGTFSPKSSSAARHLKNCSIFNFENGLDGWTKEGNAFTKQPIFGRNGGSRGHHGNWLIDSNNNATSPCQGTTTSGTLKATGTMTSPSFLIRSSQLSFLIGGGCDRKYIRMELLINGSAVLIKSGTCQQQIMERRWINVQEHRSKLAQVRLVDNSEDVWGISFDDLRHGVPCADLDPCSDPKHCEIPDEAVNQQYICSCESLLTSLSWRYTNSTRSLLNGNCSLYCNDTETNCQCIRCTCASGYLFNTSSLSCEDVDECTARKHDDCDHICNNTEGGFKCACWEGYKLDSDQESCVDINECDDNNGDCQHTCVNAQGSYYCRCRSGWVLNSDQSSCSDKNECQATNDCEQVCINTEGSYTCRCQDGYDLTSDKKCQDIDECSTNNGGCESKCTNNPGSYECSCDPGYQIGSDHKSCDDIDECARNNSGCEQICTNLPGNYNCSCEKGYRLLDDNASCSDINECSVQHDCQQQCNNFEGGYNCSCFHGYQYDKDTRSCLDVDECANSNGGCNQICVNMLGSYNCSCRRGHQLLLNDSGCSECGNFDAECEHSCIKWICVDVDECTAEAHTCQHRCRNTQGSFTCQCNDGFVLSSDNRSCQVQEKKTLKETLTEGQREIDVALNIIAVVKVTKRISDEMNSSITMSSDELSQTLLVLETFVQKMKQFNSSASEAEELIIDVTSILSSMMAQENQLSWKQLAEDEGTFLEEIPKVVEDVVTVIVHSLDKESSRGLHVVASTLNLEMHVTATTRHQFQGAETSLNSVNKVTIPKSTVKDTDEDGAVAVSIALLKGIENILPNISNTSDTNSPNIRLNSMIVVVTVINVSPEHLNDLKEPIILLFEHLEKNSQKSKCSFLNETVLRLIRENKTTESSKQWSSVGCEEDYTTEEYTVCKCYHLTSYGLIMDVHNIYDELDDVHRKTLKYISMVGCCVSIVFCFLSLLGFVLVMRKPRQRKAWRNTYRLHINLVTAIGLSQVFFVVQTFVTSLNLLTCRIFSTATNYFLTASFCWMLAEGINVYNKIVRVFSNRKYTKVFFLLGWGLPIILVSASVGVSYHYGPTDSCGLSGDYIWIFAGPVLAVIVINVFILLNVIYVLMAKTMVKTGESLSKTNKSRRSTKVAVVLLPLLGITWVFGFLAVDKDTIFFHYIFAILNSLQGLFIFLAHCWMNDVVRDAITEKIPSVTKMKGHYATKSIGDNIRNSTSTETGSALAGNASIRPISENQSPITPRKVYKQARLKLVNFEQAPIKPEKEFESDSVKLVNLAKLPPRYSDTFDIHTMKMLNVNKPVLYEPKTNSSSVKLVENENNMKTITPREAYDNPTYAFWSKSQI